MANTENEDVVYEAIYNLKLENGYPPSFRDLAKYTGLGLGTVHNSARILREEGRIKFFDHIARSLEVIT